MVEEVAASMPTQRVSRGRQPSGGGAGGGSPLQIKKVCSLHDHTGLIGKMTLDFNPNHIEFSGQIILNMWPNHTDL